MPDLYDGQTVEIQGSARLPYVLKNLGGVYSCSCPAWRNQSAPIERRTCKHLRHYRGEQSEAERIGADALPSTVPSVPKSQAPALLLAETWDGEQDVTGWLYSEKLDGVRAYWTGKHFLSRQGNVYHAPAWFTQDLPSIPLDGELWLARKSFQRTVSIVRRHDAGDLWREIRYVVFDAPALGEPFERRLKACREQFGDGVRFAVGSGFTDAQRERPPAIGSVLTFRYQELSDRGVPRFPTFVRVRTDLTAVL